MILRMLALCSGFCRMSWIYLKYNYHLNLTLCSLVNHILKKWFCILLLSWVWISLLSSWWQGTCCDNLQYKCYLWYAKVTLPLASNTYSLLLVVFVSLAVALKDLPLYQYSIMVKDVGIYSQKKDTHIISVEFPLVKIYCLFWIPYRYLDKGKLHCPKGLPYNVLLPGLPHCLTSACTGLALLCMAS